MSTTKRDVTHLTDVGRGLTAADGSFQRKPSVFRNTIEKGGQFEPEKGRYHLYVSYSCPWATRTLITRKIKGLEDIIDITAVSPKMDENGWPFANVSPFPGADVDPLYGANYIKDIYLRAEPEYEGRFTVPLLWDKKTEKVVNNESSEIIRIFNTAFNELLPADKAAIDLYPTALRKEIDELNDLVYNAVNNGVYRAGFAKAQQPYEEAVTKVFETLDKLEELLKGKDYLIGDKLTEADIRLYVTIIRFDVAYHGHFKCNIRMIRHDYPAIHLWLRKLYWNNDAFSSTCKFDHIKTSYYLQPSVASNKIVPLGPVPHILPL